MKDIVSVAAELEIMLSDIVFSGLENLPAAFLERLKTVADDFSLLGMKRGAACIGSFTDSLAAYRRGEGPFEVAAEKLCALEFYLKNIQNV